MGSKVVIAIILEIELQGVPKLVADKLLFPPHSLLNDPVEFLLHSVQILFDKLTLFLDTPCSRNDSNLYETIDTIRTNYASMASLLAQNITTLQQLCFVRGRERSDVWTFG